MAPTPIPSWASPEANTAVEGLLRRWHAYDADPRPATDYIQVLDANQLGLLRTLVEPLVPISTATVEDKSGAVPAADVSATAEDVLRGQAVVLPPKGETLLPAEHLIYFTPRLPTSTLASDGSDPSFNPPGGIFTRRMWAGGEMTFVQPFYEQAMQVGNEVRETTWIEDALVKKMRGGKGDEMLVVWLRKEYEVAGQVALLDRRSWVFRKAFEGGPAPTPALPVQTASVVGGNETHSISLSHPPATLFRFSALTYNAHQIHLDSHWARSVEGHSDVVVHGPLNVLLLCRFWHALEARKDVQRRISTLTYRAKSPVCAGEAYSLVSGPVTEAGADVVQAVRTDSGKVIMEATISSV
ncbi:hypothetical protein OC846_001290 [Tilletia horrida]|uniref:N-terminal of MaoC-like dehydratase domain-containing protein n=1 Tax=Tilletia horrida TaxID=155126 RepID=A0AAN6JT38_9BASI|nr:hypothetical protein OC846_001290 [Tilletia horrida]KAK0569141.1 hypothetical protein OC861_001281 [Tilletia horrida]